MADEKKEELVFWSSRRASEFYWWRVADVIQPEAVRVTIQDAKNRIDAENEAYRASFIADEITRPIGMTYADFIKRKTAIMESDKSRQTRAILIEQRREAESGLPITKGTMLWASSRASSLGWWKVKTVYQPIAVLIPIEEAQRRNKIEEEAIRTSTIADELSRPSWMTYIDFLSRKRAIYEYDNERASREIVKAQFSTPEAIEKRARVRVLRQEALERQQERLQIIKSDREKASIFEGENLGFSFELPPLIRRQRSTYEYNQENNGTCSIFSGTRVILNTLQHFINFENNCEQFFTSEFIKIFLENGSIPCSKPSKFIMFCFIFKFFSDICQDDFSFAKRAECFRRMISSIEERVFKDKSVISSITPFHTDEIHELWNEFFTKKVNYSLKCIAENNQNITYHDKYITYKTNEFNFSELIRKVKYKYFVLDVSSFATEFLLHPNRFQEKNYDLFRRIIDEFNDEIITQLRNASVSGHGHSMVIQHSEQLVDMPIFVIRNSHGSSNSILYVPAEILRRISYNNIFSIDIIHNITNAKLGKRKSKKKYNSKRK